MNRAITPGAGGAKGQVQMSNEIRGQHELRVKFTVAAAAGNKTDLIIKPAAWRKAADIALPAGVTFSSPDWASWEEFHTYFRNFSTHVFGMRIETSGDTAVENLSGYFTFRERYPFGEIKPVKYSVQKFREKLATATGYSETLEIPGSDRGDGKGWLAFLMWNGLDIQWSQINDGDAVEFIFYVEGWDKARTLEKLPNSII